MYGHVMPLVGVRQEMDVELGQLGRMQTTDVGMTLVFSFGACRRGRVVRERGVIVETLGCSVELGSQQSNLCSSSGGGRGAVQLW